MIFCKDGHLYAVQDTFTVKLNMVNAAIANLRLAAPSHESAVLLAIQALPWQDIPGQVAAKVCLIA
jgi:hypothetical protein